MTDSDSETTASRRSIIKRSAIAALLLIILLPLSLCGWYYSYVYQPGPERAEPSVVVTIPKGSSVEAISEILAKSGVIHSDFRFLLLAKFSGHAKHLQAGEFMLTTGQKPGEVLKTLVTARSVQYSITVPEGLRATEIADIFGSGKWCNPEEFLNLIQDKPFIERLGFQHLTSLEGYLYPDTYLLTKDVKGSEKIITLMVKRFFEVWGELTKGSTEDVSMVQTVILASIVEKETGAAPERPLIAGVFLNRLRMGMRLQSDPTVVYGLDNFSGKITKTDLKTTTPYNTYTIKGLPVGPICNPGLKAMHAVLNPESTENLYFVSKNDGTHQFSKNLREHNRAVRKYQRKKSDKQSK